MLLSYDNALDMPPAILQPQRIAAAQLLRWMLRLAQETGPTVPPGHPVAAKINRARAAGNYSGS